MDFSGIVQVISTVGFPIAAAIGCFWYMTKLNEMHREEVAELRGDVEANTAAIVKLTERMGRDG